MKDRFSDTSKQIFDNPEFGDVQNAIGQLEEIIRTARSRRQGGSTSHDGLPSASSSSTAVTTRGSSTILPALGKRSSKSSVVTITGEDSEATGASDSINNNIIISEKSTSKSNGIGTILPAATTTSPTNGISNANVTTTNDVTIVSTTTTSASTVKTDKNKPIIIISSTSNGVNNIKPSAVVPSYHKRSSTSSSSSVTTTTTAILHSTGADTESRSARSGSEEWNHNDDGQVVVRRSKGKLNGISKFSSAVSPSQHATSQAKVMILGTATVSTETTRSGSKTPEITITPGSEVLGRDLVETELPVRLLLSSAASGVGERVSPEDLPDSGCTGLLDEDEESCSSQRVGSGSIGGDQIIGRASSSPAAGPGSGGGASERGGGDRDSGGGSVASSGTGAGRAEFQRSPSGEPKEALYAQLQKRRSGSSEPSPVYPHQQQLPALLHVDGPLDGSPYAVINPLVKHKGLSDSGISFDQMKDLDRLLNALVQEAESIDIPYHARQDSLPFSYTAPSGPPPSSAPAQLTGSKRSPYGGIGTTSRYATGPGAASSAYPQQQHSPYGASATIAASGGRYRGLEHSLSTPGTRLSSSVPSPAYQQPQVPQYYQSALAQSALEEQIVNPEPITSYSRSISRQPSIPGGSSNNVARLGGRGASASEQPGYRVRPSLSSTSFSNYGNGTGGARRLRSQSADGRRDMERDEDADEWLARQMKRLQEKRASRNAPRSDWLAELKAALPAATAGGLAAGATPSAMVSTSNTSMSVTGGVSSTERSYEQSRATTSISEYRPYSASTMSKEVMASTNASVLGGAISAGMSGGGGRRSHVSYSSEEDDDVELEMFQRGRRVQRHYSESAYDRGMTSGSSTRAPSQLSNVIETPFPTCPPTPYFNRPVSPGKPPRSPKGIRRQISASVVPILQEIPSRMERSQTPVNPRPIYMVDSEVKFAQDLSEYWYKPFASREETVSALVNSSAGTFLIRNSNSFPGAFGLAVKVSDSVGEKGIRHFLIEPTRFGVRLRGSPLEPVFSSLSALVYAHSIDPLALPIALALPNFDILPKSSQSTTGLLLRQGAACQLLFLGITSVECLTGDEAIHRGISQISGKSPIPISLRLSKHGLTLTDVFRKQFFRLHFALNDISHASLVPGRSVSYGNDVKHVFGIVARAPRASENSVIVLAEFEQGQPANAIVSFILRVIAWQH